MSISATRDDSGSPCPLCRHTKTGPFHRDDKRSYLLCQNCTLVFVPEHSRLSREEEKAIYDLHENRVDDAGYRRFLSRLSTPLLERLDRSSRGLDFGCGPGPALKVLAEEHGHKVDLYDPYYFDDRAVFRNRYDFITATEVVEHLRRPGRDFDSLFRLLKPGGWLGIMTKLVRNREAFGSWHYIRDPTHICFYSRSTFEHIARYFRADLNFVGNDVILLRKK